MLKQSLRYAACVEYDGSNFSGWQRQKHKVRTVQNELERALTKVADHEIQIVTAGRTDTGVHASHQVIHYDSNSQRDEFSWCRGANRFLPQDVRVSWVIKTTDEFHARFSALNRSYRFIIYNRPIASALYRKLSTHEFRKLEVEKMAEAGSALVGRHDFSSFRAAGCQASSPIRTVERFSLYQKDEWIWFDITANAFLQHMVRNLAGSLIEVGYGKRPISWIAELLELKDRTKAGVTATPNGLYLQGVGYPKELALPSALNIVSYWGKSE